MAANKNQHFVPRCYLRPFSGGGEAKVIHLFNLDREKAIPNAPVKGQCSGDYFYGEDLQLEHALGLIEGRYAAALKAILAPDYRLTAADTDLLRGFWLLQYMRTEAASRRSVEMFEQLDDDLGGLPPGYRVEIREAVQTAMGVFFDALGSVADLSVALVRNRSPRAFVTSDNPAVMTNRWHLTDARARGVAPGLANAGMTGFLPLSPAVMCVLYDGGVHTVAHDGGWVDLRHAEDADAFNEQQVLNCQANLYFERWEDADILSEFVAAVAGRRPVARHAIDYAVFDHMEGTAKVFRAVSAEEAKGHADAMMHSALVLPIPSRWPPQVAWRAGGAVWDSGTGAGFARRLTRDDDGTYVKLRVRR